MGWDANLVNLKYVLADLYFLKEDSVPVVRNAGLPPAQISFSNRATTNWSNILDEADKRGKVFEVIRAALKDYPENELLRSALKGQLTPIKPLIDDAPDWDWKNAEPPGNLEKLMGKQSNLLPVNWLAKGLQCARSVARVKLNDKGYGTGFLIKDNLFVTNHHVLKDERQAGAAIIQFNYESNEAGLAYEPKEFELDPASFFATSKIQEDDWTVVRLKGEANAEWGALELREVEVKVHERAHIIQHPGGEAKQIAVHRNLVTYADERRVQYLTDTLPGSSGSPVFNHNWELIAVHHKGGWFEEPGGTKPVYRNEGISIGRVMQGLAQRGIEL